jgi:hypothetical protein
MAVGGYKNANVVNPEGGYQEPFVVITLILAHINSYYVKSNRLAFKYLDFKKDVNPNAHVKMFNFVIKVNAKTMFNYTLKDTTLD